MKTLEEHQNERLEACRREGSLQSGVKCPKCPDGEFYYIDVGVLLLSNPPQRSVRCRSCDYRTNIYA